MAAQKIMTSNGEKMHLSQLTESDKVHIRRMADGFRSEEIMEKKVLYPNTNTFRKIGTTRGRRNQKRRIDDRRRIREGRSQKFTENGLGNLISKSRRESSRKHYHRRATSGLLAWNSVRKRIAETYGIGYPEAIIRTGRNGDLYAEARRQLEKIQLVLV